MKVNFILISKKEQIEKVAQIADETWHEHYNDILDADQIDYMVEKFQSIKAIVGQMVNEDYSYILLHTDGEDIGYVAIREEKMNKELFLSKIYILKKYRGKGFATQTFQYLEDFCKGKGYTKIWLTVNKYNLNSIKTYEKKGFKKIRTQVVEIGEGYVMDDYVMEKDLVKE